MNQEWDWDGLKTHFGYRPSIGAKNSNNLVNIWNIIGKSYEIRNPYLILDDETLEKIKLYLSSSNNTELLKWGWDKYRTRSFNKVISVTDYNFLIEEKRKKEEQAKIREEERKRQEEMILSKDLKILADLKETYKSTWVDSKWINSIIGTYDNPFAEYYWTLITKDNYKIVDWKGNVKIREDIYKVIENDKTFSTYSGKKFLSRSFLNKKGYPTYIIGSYPFLTYDESGWGIYGIYYSNTEEEEPELIYIGMTSRGFETRWKEHYNIFKGVENPSTSMILYQQNLDANKISFGKLIDVKELKYEGIITTREIKAIELALITLYKPKYNTMGINKPYILD